MSDILHVCLQPEGSPLLIMLEDVMTTDKNALGHTLVRFYLAHGSVLPFLDTLTTREIYSTSECPVCVGSSVVVVAVAVVVVVAVVDFPPSSSTPWDFVQREFSRFKII